MHPRVVDNLKYLTIQRSRITFTHEINKFLQEANLVSFSFVLNSEAVAKSEFESE